MASLNPLSTKLQKNIWLFHLTSRLWTKSLLIGLHDDSMWHRHDSIIESCSLQSLFVSEYVLQNDHANEIRNDLWWVFLMFPIKHKLYYIIPKYPPAQHTLGLVGQKLFRTWYRKDLPCRIGNQFSEVFAEPFLPHYRLQFNRAVYISDNWRDFSLIDSYRRNNWNRRSRLIKS